MYYIPSTPTPTHPWNQIYIHVLFNILNKPGIFFYMILEMGFKHTF